MTAIALTMDEFVTGLGFPEAPRWHDGALWCSDIIANKVLRIGEDGAVATVLRTPDEPSGIGWLPDGQMLVVQMQSHEIWRWNGKKLHRYSGTSPMSRSRLNDMVVDWNGRAWVSNFGFDYEHELPRTTNLICVDPGGHAWIAAEDLWCPNGMAIDPSGTRLIIGQSANPQVIEYEIHDRGVLDERSIFGTLPEGRVCDGLCMDSAGALWIAAPTTHEFLRMEPGGRITHRVDTGERHAIACVLGGPKRQTLFCLTTTTLSIRAAHRVHEGRIGRVQVETPGAGIP